MNAMPRGFTEPVYDSQASFRMVMEAFAAPGRILTLLAELEPPEPLNVAATATLLALCDFETTLWLSPSLAGNEKIGEYLCFHTGTRLVSEPSAASFALVDLTRDALELGSFAIGTPEYPDRSTTVVALCTDLAGADAMSFSGPGIAHEAKVGFSPRPEGFTRQWDSNRDMFPLGVDLIFTCGLELVALPRSARRQQEIR